MEYLMKQKPAARKILFTGLDNAGKTSIILALQRKFSKIVRIEPTRGAERHTFKLLGNDISEWDLGGQKTYRISYLKNPNRFFDRTEIAIYVIDILNTSRIPESISYLSDVIEQFKILKIDPPINIFLHKCDPLIFKNKKDETRNLINNIVEKIESQVKYRKLHYFKTSIYDLYSIMRTMSKILLELYPKSQIIEKTVEEFAKKLNCEGLMIVDNNTLIIGSYFENKTSKFLLKKSISYFLTLNDSFLEIGLGERDDQILAYKLGKYFLFKQVMFQENTLPYYVFMLKGSNPIDLYFMKKEFIVFIEILNDILKI